MEITIEWAQETLFSATNVKTASPDEGSNAISRSEIVRFGEFDLFPGSEDLELTVLEPELKKLGVRVAKCPEISSLVLQGALPAKELWRALVFW